MRASDGGLHSDVTVAVNVTDVAEAPAFAEGSYAFSLAENADGGATRVGLGAVSAADPENSTITYSIEAGNPGGLFAIDFETGALSYQGTGEDYDSGTTSYELTVRASDGSLHTDVTVTVNVTDVQEAPAFAEASYAFDLAENADGGATSVALGAVSATDPENSTITYSIEAGNSDGLFAIDSETGALSYQGAGEDYESGTMSYELTVRAGDGSLHSDVAVTVNVTDVEEYVILEQEATETQQSVSEPDGQDLPAGASTTGLVAVGGSATGNIGTGGDRDWFAVEFEAGRTYVIDLEGSETGAGTLRDPYLRGVYDANGVFITGTRNDDGGAGYNSRVTFTAEEAGTYYVAAGAFRGREGTYTVRVREWVDTDAERGGATDLGDITELAGPQFPAASLDGSSDSVDYWRFTLSEARRVGLDLRQQDANADLFVEDAEGNVLYSSTEDGTANEWISRTLLAGTYFVRAEAQEEGANEFKLRYGVSAANPAEVAALEQQQQQQQQQRQQQQGTDEAPEFVSGSYGFSLAENADGATTSVALGAVSATDPEDGRVSYSIEAGNSDGLFAIDSETGALSYQGTGEDYESGTTSYELTVRASDGSLHSDVTVTVNVTDAQEAPAFAEGSYAFSLAENADGGATSVALGAVSATDPEDGTVTYSIEAGDSGGLFAIDSETGALSYQGTGEDYESGTTGYELTVRASDGSLHSDVTVTVNVTDAQEAPAFAEGSYAFSLAENADGGATSVALGAVSATDPEDSTITYSIEAGDSGGLFAIDSETGALSYQGAGEDYESGTTSYELTVRASDGSLHSDVTVTVNVTDAQEAPAFAEGSYAFDLAENADGGAIRVALGAVSATDPEDGTVTYSIEAGNSDGLFAIDSETGALSYQGAGEDYESGTTSYDLTVRASDGSLHSEVTVTVNVIDAQEAPAFAEGSYAFDLAENADGATISVALGAVSATDPEDSTITYSIEAGNPGGLFAIDSETGALSYQGAGEDYESGTTSYELTVRAGDGSLHSDVTVTVNVTDVEEYVILAQQATETQQSVSEPGGQDLPEGASTTGRVAVGGSATGEIDYEDDRDWFAVEFKARRTYQIDLEGSETGAGTLGDPYLRGIHDADGNFIAGTTNDDGGDGYNSRVTFTATEDATYYVAAGANVGGRGTYTLSVVSRDVEEGDFASSTRTSGVVDVGGSATGQINYGNDRDWFAVTLEAGKTYQIDMRGESTGDGNLRSPYLRGVHDTDGVLIPGTTNNNGGVFYNSRVFFKAEEDATYYVAAGAYQTETGTYKLSVRDVTDTFTDDFEAGTETTGTVAVDGSVRGNLEYGGDRDWFAVELEAGKSYRIDLKGLLTGNGNLINPYLHGIHDANGILIPGTTNDNSDVFLSSRVYFTAEENGTYYVAAGGYGDGSDGMGTYRLWMTDLSDDFEAGTETTGAVEVGGSATGKIGEVGDRDWFAVELDAGRTYQIDLKGSRTGNGTLTDPYLRGVHDADGVLIAGTKNNNVGANYNSRVTFTPVDAGTYYVATGANGAGTGAYTLFVADVTDGVPDDFAAGTGTSGTVAVDASAPGEIETRDDRDWFAVELKAARTYQIDLKGSSTGADTLTDPYLRGVYDANGDLIAGTTDDDDGSGDNSRVTFTAEEDATYYVEAGADGYLRGTYTLRVKDVTPDDFEEGTGTSGAVEVGGSARGEINPTGDHDWFAVELDAGKTYRIELKGYDTGDGTLRDPHLRGIFNADGNSIAYTSDNNGGVGRNSRVTFTAGRNATYYVEATAGVYHEGTYTLSVWQVVDDFSGWTGTSGAVEVGGSATGAIETRGDRDWFAVELEAGKTYRIDMEGSWTGAGTLRSPYLSGIYDANGRRLPNTADITSGPGYNNRVDFTAEEDATYYVAAGGSGYNEGTYTLSVTEYPDVFAAGTETSGAVEVGGSATGAIEFRGDRDWFALTLEASRTYRIDLEGSATGAGTLTDAYLRGIHDADGNLIAGTTDNDGGVKRNSRVFFTAEDAGAYYVAAGAHGGAEGAYTLSVTEIPDDFEAGTGTSGAVEVGGSATGAIEFYDDRDWFAMTLTVGRTYQIDLEGSRTGAGTLGDPYLRGVHDANGVFLPGTRNDDGGVGNNSRVTFTAQEDGVHYVAAGADGDGEGTYTLSVTELSDSITDDYLVTTQTTGAVVVEGSVTGEIDYAHDRDWFAVALEAGKIYRIDLEGSETGAGTLSDPYLRGIYDAAGVLIAGTTDDDDGARRNSRVYFTAQEDATYYVAVGAAGDGEGAYTLSVTEATDDFAAGTETTGTVEVGGSATGEIDFFSDRDWFAVEFAAGSTYRIDLKGGYTGSGTLRNPYLRGVHEANGDLIPYTDNDRSGAGLNSRLTFTAEETATYYVAAGGSENSDDAYSSNSDGTYTLSVEEVM